jgi:hypothetical protein
MLEDYWAHFYVENKVTEEVENEDFDQDLTKYLEETEDWEDVA